MASNKLKYAFVALYFLVIVQFSSCFKIGSRGLNEPDMARDIDTEHEADDDFKQMSESPNVSKYPGLMKNDRLNYENSLNKEKLVGTGNRGNYLFVSFIAGCTLAGLLAVIAGGVCLYTIKRKDSGIDGKQFFGSAGMSKSGSVKSNASSSSGDRRLAQSAQMFHYQHQKQQMIAMEKANNDTKQDQSDNSEGETEEGDYTVYECPGLAPTGEMEVKNPLFKEEFPSSTNLTSSNSITSMPPAYSTVTSDAKPSQLQSESAAEKTNLIEVNETVASDAQQLESASTAAKVNNTETTSNGMDKQ